jgi:glycosyltransferase involved in cell wall biosynthesis
MRILIDLQSCQSGSRLGGIGRYSLELTKAILRDYSDRHEFWIVVNDFIHTTETEIRYELRNLIPQEKISCFQTLRGVDALNSPAVKVKVAELMRESFICELNPELVHITSLMEGLQEDIVTSIGRLYPADRTVVTWYDLIPLANSERYLSARKPRLHYLGKLEQLKQAGLLLSISNFSRDEAIELINIDDDKIVNISSAADARFAPVQLTTIQTEEIKKRYNIKNKFLMYTSSFDIRKNHTNLIKAFAKLPKNQRSQYQLLIIGNGWDGIYRDLRAVAQTAGLDEKDIIFAGHVPDVDLLPLYTLCSLFVFPSLAEGFGLPVLEAMSCGTPTICSNCTSLPEVIGIAEAQFEPTSPSSIAEVMLRALTDDKFRKKLIAHGINQASKFSWAESARRAVTAMELLGKSFPPPSNVIRDPAFHRLKNELEILDGFDKIPDAALLEISERLGANLQQVTFYEQGGRSDLRVGWVTTWNTRCGIATYSKFLLEHFHADVTILAQDVEETTSDDASNVVRCWSSVGEDSLERLWEIIRKKSIEVLLIQFNYGFFEFINLNKLIENANRFGIRVVLVFHSTNDPADNKRLAYLSGTLSECHALLVHSMKDVKVLSNIGLSHNTKYIPHGLLDVTAVKKPSFDNKMVIAAYGFALPGKGLEQILEAFAMLNVRMKGRVHLLFVNAEYPDRRSAELLRTLYLRIEELGLTTSCTIISEFLSDEDSVGYLQTADLIVFAYQKTGESASGAVRVALASGVPVAVTPIPIFDDIGDAVFRLSGITVDAIANGLEEILQNLAEQNMNARRIAANAELLRNTNRFAAIAPYLHWICLSPNVKQGVYNFPIDFEIQQSMRNPRIYKAADSDLRTVIGRRDRDCIQTTSTEGNLLHGPFVSVEEGFYQISIKGHMAAASTKETFAEIAIHSGTTILHQEKVLPQSTEVLIAMRFHVPAGGCTDLEVRIHVDEHVELAIDHIQITPVTLR